MSFNKTMIVGLTGGIACGKSLVLSEFKKLGAAVIDADKIAHQVLNNNSVKNKLVQSFGKDILNNKLKINRKILGDIAFAKKNNLKLLNRITHPIIIQEIKQQIKQKLSTKNELIIIDAPLLFEAKITQLVDKIIVVTANKKVQIQRLIKRNRLTRKQSEQRVLSQMPITRKIKHADFVIDNSENRRATIGVTKKIFFLLKNT